MKKTITRMCMILAGMFMVLAPVAADPGAGCFNRASGLGNMVTEQLARLETTTIDGSRFRFFDQCAGVPIFRSTRLIRTFAINHDGDHGTNAYAKFEYPDLGYTQFIHVASTVLEDVSDVEVIAMFRRTDYATCENYGTAWIQSFLANDIPFDYGEAVNHPLLDGYTDGDFSDYWIFVENSSNCDTMPDVPPF